jgi:hypothetical protein
MIPADFLNRQITWIAEILEISLQGRRAIRVVSNNFRG